MLPMISPTTKYRKVAIILVRIATGKPTTINSMFTINQTNTASVVGFDGSGALFWSDFAIAKPDMPM